MAKINKQNRPASNYPSLTPDGQKGKEKPLNEGKSVVKNDDSSVSDAGIPRKSNTSEIADNRDTLKDKESEKPISKLDRVAIAKGKMIDSKNKWKEESIHFDISDYHNKYVGCVSKRIGVTHINKGTHCQDSCCVISNAKRGFTIVAIADGHGDESHDLSEHGSEIACKQLCEYVSEILEDKKFINKDFFTSVEFRSVLVKRWEKSVLTYHKNEYNRDASLDMPAEKILTRYGTTLLFAIAFDGFYIVGQLGDGGIMILNKDDSKCRIHKPLTSKKVGSGTASLCMTYADSFIDMKVYPEEECSGIALMTDGYYDLWISNENRFGASRFFLNTLLLNSFDKDKTERSFREKYNEAVDYVSDDISIAVLMPSIKVGGKNSDCKVLGTHSSCTRTTYNVQIGKNDLIGVFLNDFKNRKLKNEASYPFKNIIYTTCKYISISGLPCYLYSHLCKEYFTLDDYCEDFIINKKYRMDTIMSVRVLINILKTICDAKELFCNRIISLSEMTSIIEFSTEGGEARIYWTYPQIAGLLQSENYVEVFAKFAINFLSAGKMFYDEKSNYLPPYKGSLYEMNVKKYPMRYINLLLKANVPKSDISIETILHETISLQQLYVRCSSCGKVILCDKENYDCVCGKDFEIFGVLRNTSNADEFILIPLSANTVISVYSSSTSKYEKVAEILKEKEKIGVKNISSNTWTAIVEDEKEVDVMPNQIKDISNCVSLKFYDDKYVIDYEYRGEYYGATE